ncbi:MAG: ATP-binding protein [Bacteroidales bacterium]|nr:ATP-binding protein [Bacteroidales bacterium]
MGKSIEFKIRFKAAIIYLIVALAVVAMTLYLNALRKNISFQRLEIESQQVLLLAVNDLMVAVNDAQSSVSLFISTRNGNYLNDYTLSVGSIEKLIDTIAAFKPAEEEKLQRIAFLLHEQMQNVTELNRQFTDGGRIGLTAERKPEIAPHSSENIQHASSAVQDTVVSELPRKGLLRRLGEVFNPSRDAVTIVVNQRADTVKTVQDNLTVVYQEERLAQQAQRIYEENLRTIERRVAELISSNRDINMEIFALLLEFHKETLHSILTMIDTGEEAIWRNYVYSSIGGVFGLAIILVFIILIITDINKGREARLALEAAHECTRRIMESRHRLLLAVSHDVKTPLQSMMGYLALMESDPNVRSMQNSSEHILAMLENLLGFSSLERGTLLKSDSDFNIKNLFEDIHNMFLPLASQKSLAFSFVADDVRIRTDRVKLKQMVINLVSNAIKYTQAGSVTFNATFDKNRLHIKVEDTGMGIPPQKQSQLFKPFSRIEENSSAAEGTGLGMFVVHGITELLGGSIALSSQVGEGTVVTVAIPAEYAQVEVPQGAKRIKIYDDNPVVVKIVSDMLLRLGHKVVENDYNFVITDMEMGDISGLDVLRQVAGAVPVAVMTGRADFSAQKAAELGFSHFLAKPFTIESLREVAGEGGPCDELLGDSRDEIMSLFRVSTTENFSILKEAVAHNNFAQAQAVCHKIFPMFAQLGYPTEELRKMDAHRNSEYEGWREDVEKILSIVI